VVEEGLTEMLAEVAPPGFHEYEVAPEAVKVAVEPEQIFPPPLILSVGVAITVTVEVLVLEQVPFWPVTVYTVVEPGLTTRVVAFDPPGDQVYVEAPDAVSVAEDPEQIDPPPVAVTVGEAVTFTVTVESDEHPDEVPVTL
jgi:hypothetical protein